MWWKDGVFYQIYPRSFYDSNGDGVGDLNGINEKLPHLKWLGIDAFWISPFYPSPMADFGYDISNYKDIDPIFGTLDDFDQLLKRAHELGLKLIIDYVANHSSSIHPWFLESRSSRDNPKRDWYVWKDPNPDGSPPNNWISRFDGKSSWEYDEKTGQYYLHSFLKEQPDLNWRNDEVKKAMLDVMRFWMDRGVDGFRVDASYYCMKDPELKDNPNNPDWRPGMDPALRLLELNSKNHKDIHYFNRWLREVTEEYGNKVLVGELYLPFDKLVHHYGENNEYHMPFNFSLIHALWKADIIGGLIVEYEKHLPSGAWPNWVLGNHDKPRIASRINPAQVRNSLLMLLTLRGTPTIYYGEELGLENGSVPPEYVHDPLEKNVPGLGLGRDPSRTPMLWDSSANAGFSTENPWLPVHPNFKGLDVMTQAEQAGSILNYTRELLRLRRSNLTLVAGTIEFLHSADDVLVYTRTLGDEQLMIVINLSSDDKAVNLPGNLNVLSTVFETLQDGTLIEESTLHCPKNQGVILAVQTVKLQ